MQSNSTQCKVHDLRAATENCMKCGFSYETDCWRNYCELRLLKEINLKSVLPYTFYSTGFHRFQADLDFTQISG